MPALRFSGLCLCCLWAAAGAPAAERPNIIFVMADDLGYGDLGCYGQKQIRTPNIDRMAAEGLRFTDYYAGSTVCAPSRCVLMTGLHTGRCYIRGNSKMNLRAGDVTVAEVLARAGYKCGLFGKWGLGHENTGGIPNVQGFDRFYGYLDQHHAHNYYPSFLMRDFKREQLNNVVEGSVPGKSDFGRGVATEKNEYSHDLIFAEALQYIDEVKDHPFFIYLAVTIPHANNEAGKAGMEVPDYGDYKDKDWPEPQKGLAAMITRLDTDVGLLFDRLKEHNLDEKTVVFFTSDNGPHAEGGNDPNFFDSNGPLKGIKRDLYEGGIRVPLIVNWPGKVQPGRVSHHVAYHGDLMATVGEMAGAYVPTGIDSVSLLPTILGQEDGQKRHDYLYWEFYERGFGQAVRVGKWKAIRRGKDNATVEVYNLETDQGEEHDVAAERADVVKVLVGIMDAVHVPSPDWVPKKPGGEKSKAQPAPAAAN